MEYYIGKNNNEHKKLIFVQPSLPAYRIDFFKKLSRKVDLKLLVYHSAGRLGALSEHEQDYPWSIKIGKMIRLIPGLEWQKGAMGIPLGPNDIIVVSGGPRCVSNMLLLVRARLKGLRVIWWGHLWSSTTKKHRFYLRLLLMKLANELLFYTDKEVNTYLQKYGTKEKRPVAALNNGINTDPIISLRAQYDPNVRGRNLLFIGRLTEKARLELLLYALAEPELRNVTLNVIGGGEQKDQLENLCSKLGIERQVNWHEGTTNEVKIAKIANQCSLFVYPGGVGLSLVHAMAYGLPAIVHNTERYHMPEIAAFKEGLTGKAFIYEDIKSLAETISSLLVDEVALKKMSKEAIQVTKEKFNTDAMSEAFVKLLKHATK